MATASNRSETAAIIAREALIELSKARNMTRIEDRDYYAHAFNVLARTYRMITGVEGTEAELRVAAGQ